LAVSAKVGSRRGVSAASCSSRPSARRTVPGRADHRGGEGHNWRKGLWRGFAAPKGLPKETATQYETAIKKIWDSAEFKEFMNRRGFDMIYLDSAGFAEFMKADNEDNGKALKSLGLAK
jgi:tripartite-type tricarboxylate transporter receptor subunit TctC